MRHLPRSRKCQFRTRAPQQISSRTFPVVCFVYLSVECPFDKFYGINCRLKLGAKLLYRFFHRRRQISPTVNNVTHRFFDSSQHSLYCNFTVGFRHSAAASSSSSKRQQNSSSAGLPRQYHRTKGTNLSSRMEPSVPSRSCPPRTPRGAWPASSCRTVTFVATGGGQANYSAGNTTSTPFFFRRITMNFAGSVVLALRPTVCTSLGPS